MSPVIPLHAESASGCATAPVLRERGQREVFCGLTGIVWLHRKIQDAFFLVVGSRTCAHLMQSAAGVMIFAEPRFATAIIDERDLAGLADAQRGTRPRRRAACSSAGPTSALLFLVGSCPSEVIKLDLSRAAQRLNQRIHRCGAGAQLLGQRHRDHLHPGRRRLPGRAGAGHARAADGAPASLLVVGALADVVEDQFARLFGHAWGVPGVRLPAGAAQRRACRRSGRARATCWPSPSSATRRARWRRAARVRIAAPFPLGVEGTTAWLQAGAPAMRRRRRRRSEAALAAGARTRRGAALARLQPAPARQAHLLLPGFAAGDCRSRASSSRELGMRARSRSARPTCTASTWRQELALLPAGTAAERRPGRRAPARPLPRRPARPDRLRPRSGQPAGGRGPRPRSGPSSSSSRPSTATSRPADLAELFARPLRRRALLAALEARSMQLDALDLRRPAACRRDARRHRACAGVHYVLHAPQGDTYADLLFTMIERRDQRPPVTYTTFQARDLGGDTAELFKTRVRARPTSASSRRRCSSARRAPPS
jgi:light-independent protochlorophyllide reductase subunit N